MRLWHEALIPYLPRQQLLGLHREVCALRGGGWGKKHSTVDYVFRHLYSNLVAYHILVMDEMKSRGYKPCDRWFDFGYRGENKAHLDDDTTTLVETKAVEALLVSKYKKVPIYPEHNAAYLRECLENLARKGIVIEMEIV